MTVKNVGILSYGTYIPLYRLKTDEIAAVWGKKSENIRNSLGISEKSVAAPDEDSVTMAYEASLEALSKFDVNPGVLEAILVGSESHPYAVNPTSTIIGEFLGVETNYLASDLQFACKAGTSAAIAVAGLISSNIIKTALIVGTDCAQSKPHDILEYSAASAACALILSNDVANNIASIESITSVSSDTPDFWRRDGVRFPSHGGRFTGEPSYFRHVELASQNLLKANGCKPSDFKYCVFHMPNGKFPRVVAKRLGFKESQQAPSLVVDSIGNPYSASSLLGLSAVLDIAQKGDLIFMVSYGSGAGSDGLILKVNKTPGKKTLTLNTKLNRKQYISYLDYLKFSNKL